MRILITGVAGFIGSHLSEKLLSEGHSVIGIDNFDIFYSKQIKLINLSKSLSCNAFYFLEADIQDEKFIKSKITGTFDLVIHLAAKAGVMGSIKNPEEYISTNIAGSLSILNIMQAFCCDKLIFASSSSVYGNGDKIPFKEEQKANSPVSVYAVTKKSMELLNYSYFNLYNYKIINFRFFSVYGPRLRPDLAIYKFFDSAYKSKPVDVYGDGLTARDYTYIEDILDGIVAGVKFLKESQNPIYEIINLGNNQYIFLKDLIQQIEELSGIKI